MRIGNSNLNPYEHLAILKRINKASDDAAGLAISQKLTSQTNGYNKAVENIRSMKDLTETADGALSSVNDSLSRIRELSVQASNGIYTADDRKLIQKEIEGLKSSIQDVANNTEFNTQKLLDGSFSNKNVASTPSGSGQKINIQDASLQSLGIKDFDVTGSFNISDIDEAITKVTESRGELGATSNAFDVESTVSEVAAENLTAANSNLSDLDIGKALIELNTQNILQQYQYFSQKQSSEQKASYLNIMT